MHSSACGYGRRGTQTRQAVGTSFFSPGILELWSHRDQRRMLRSITSTSSAKWRLLSEAGSEAAQLRSSLYALLVYPRNRVGHEGMVNLAIPGELVCITCIDVSPVAIHNG